MPSKLIIVQCASPGCDNTFATGSKDFEPYCPDCRLASIQMSGPCIEEPELPEDYDCVHDPDYVLKRKLESAAFSILCDAGPEDAAFPSGARFTPLELHYLLLHDCIAVNSIFIDNRTRRCHRVRRNPRGFLVLVPPVQGQFVT
jgi:hypothetical protein